MRLALRPLAAAFLLASAHGALAQGADEGDPATACHRLAAHPADPDRLPAFDGVALDSIDAAAVPACEAAVAAAPGDARLRFELGRALVAADRSAEAVRNFEAALDGGYAAAGFSLGLLYQSGDMVPEDDARGMAMLRRAADLGHAGAMTEIGYDHEHGDDGMPVDLVEAARWYRRAADLGDPLARTNLGLLYADGLGGLPEDDREAVRLHRLSAETGDPVGQNNLAWMLESGQGVERDEAEALRWYSAAAEQDWPIALVSVGEFHEAGLAGLPADPAEAARWYRRAVDLGDDYGRVALGLLMLDGLGVEKDEPGALALFRQAAEAGDRYAFYALGVVARDGRAGEPQDFAEAAEWFRKAADLLEPDGSFGLAMLHLEGRGMPRDEAEGMRLLAEAAADGSRLARLELERRGGGTDAAPTPAPVPEASDP